MRGRPKKYKDSKRILIFLDRKVIDAFDKLHTNRSSTINKILERYIKNTTSLQPTTQPA